MPPPLPVRRPIRPLRRLPATQPRDEPSEVPHRGLQRFVLKVALANLAICIGIAQLVAISAAVPTRERSRLATAAVSPMERVVPATPETQGAQHAVLGPFFQRW